MHNILYTLEIRSFPTGYPDSAISDYYSEIRIMFKVEKDDTGFEILTRAYGDVRDKTGKKSETGINNFFGYSVLPCPAADTNYYGYDTTNF